MVVRTLLMVAATWTEHDFAAPANHIASRLAIRWLVCVVTVCMGPWSTLGMDGVVSRSPGSAQDDFSHERGTGRIETVLQPSA